jgi:hypothetical protein
VPTDEDDAVPEVARQEGKATPQMQQEVRDARTERSQDGPQSAEGGQQPASQGLRADHQSAPETPYDEKEDSG